MTIYNREDSRTTLPQMESQVAEALESFFTREATDILMPDSTVDIDFFRFQTYGKVAMIYFRAKVSEAKSGTWTVATMRQQYLPALQAGAVTGDSSARAYIVEGGNIYYYGSASADSYIYVKSTYLMGD